MIDEQDWLSFTNRAQWREWLETHHGHSTEVWIVLFKKGIHDGVLTLNEAVEEALCFGWIDGKLISLDKAHYRLRFTPRKKGSIWSVRNIRRAESLIKAGLMRQAGLVKINEARVSGEWDKAVERERTDFIPDDLEKALRSKKGALDKYNSLTNSRKKQLLYWILDAKRPGTRQRRIESILQEIEKRANN